MTNLSSDVDELKENKYVVKYFDSSSTNIAANAYYTYTIDVSVSGYKPIGIISIQSNRGSRIKTDNWWFSDNYTKLNMYVFNNSSVTQESIKTYATIVFAKESLVEYK